MKNKKSSEGNKKIKKKIKIKLLPLIIFIVICLIFYLLYLIIIDLPIKNIYISGNNTLNDYDIIKTLEISDYPSFIKTTDNLLKKRAKNNLYINKIKVKRKFYNKIYIEVKENEPVLIDQDNMLVLSNGKKVDNNKNIVLPMLINYVPDTKYEDLIKKIAKINKKIWIEVSELKYEPTEQDKDRFRLYMNDGNVVYLTLTKFNKINYYNEIVSEFKCQKGILNLDSGNHFEIKENYCE